MINEEKVQQKDLMNSVIYAYNFCIMSNFWICIDYVMLGIRSSHMDMNMMTLKWFAPAIETWWIAIATTAKRNAPYKIFRMAIAKSCQT